MNINQSFKPVKLEQTEDVKMEDAIDLFKQQATQPKPVKQVRVQQTAIGGPAQMIKADSAMSDAMGVQERN